MTRREFCIAAAAATAARTFPAMCAPPSGERRWYKGNLHCHTYWSDGRAFPDQVVRSYRDAGYDFCAVTDHNRMGESRDFWRKVEPTEGGWPPRTVPIYSSAVGATVKSVSGGKGERVAADYSLAADDLYVRARVESDERAPYYALGGKGAMHPKTAMAWTQPYQEGRRV